ncbi:MAG: DEAD/DEAH box helicase [Deltaproteobacteria bacterium]|nr:DEAD/DEAH box helicase [Deltaproteobacteria bacterium]MBK8234813.1 DEAD/DEAH box helicase [Deltaproteobacteria bacterium]MBP7288444.1 DEAD/DEAH box helicase [Nannocystaceae bacterium]
MTLTPDARGEPTSSSVPSSCIRCTPVLRVVPETLFVAGDGDCQEIPTAALELSFDYGGVRVRASAARAPSGLRRDIGAEAQARRVLEGFGPIEVESLDHCAPSPDADFDYVVDPHGDAARLCSFSSHAIPQLRALGWQVEVDGDLQLEIIDGSNWYASMESDERGWFELELGVELDGRRVDLLPVLLDIIQSKGFDRISRGVGRTAIVDLGARRHLIVPAERLQTLLKVLSELYRVEGTGKDGKLRIPEMVPGWLDKIDEAFGEAPPVWHGRSHTAAIERMRQPHEPADSPKGLQAELRPYQKLGLAFLQRIAELGQGGVLADDMGLGKTLQTIAHIVACKQRGMLRSPALIVTPTSLVGNWRRELKKFAPSLRVLELRGADRHRRRLELPDHDVVITSYGLLVRDREQLVGARFSMLVADEAQTIKNARSQAHQAVRSLDADHRVFLTGTPIENNLEELWALFDLLLPGLLGDAATFRAVFRGPIERDGNAQRMESLRSRIAPFVLRRMKDQVAKELPPKTEIVRAIELHGSQRDLYEGIRLAGHAAVRQAVKQRGMSGAAIDILGALMKLRQVCCDPRLVRVSAAREIEESAKLQALCEMVETQLGQDRNILIFSQFATMLGLIGQSLKARGIEFALLTGATADREAECDRFQSGRVRVFLISLKAGGTGLNLTRADTVIHYDPWWNPAAQNQATDRAYRIGQKRPVFVYKLIIAGSVEERMIALQQRKQSLSDALLATGGPGGVPWTEGDVDDLFAPLSAEDASSVAASSGAT